jgi:RNA polymerase sigma factor (sigma-70 family)
MARGESRPGRQRQPQREPVPFLQRAKKFQIVQRGAARRSISSPSDSHAIFLKETIEKSGVGCMSKVSPWADDLIPTRYSLLSRLQDWGDQESWKVFFDLYWRLIYSVAIKSGLSEAEAQDVVQETVIRVAKGIHKFKRDRALGSFKGWLRNVTRWCIADQLEKRRMAGPHERVDPSDHGSCPVLEEIPDPASLDLESVWDAEWQANLFHTAIERVKRCVKEEHYQVFHLYVVKQWPAGEISRALKVNVGQVYLIKHRISTLIKREIRILKKTPV